MNTTFENCTLLDTYTWFQKARPNPTVQDFTTQLGVHYEEVAESLEELEPRDLITAELILEAQAAIIKLADHLKANAGIVQVEDRALFLDSLCDQIVTATGVGYTLGYDMVGALTEVNRSNFSKFVDGEPVFDANKKVTKGPSYSPAMLGPYLPAITE